MQPDVVCLQETKLADDAFPALAFQALGYESAHHGEGQWNGVAIVSRVGLDDVRGRLRRRRRARSRGPPAVGHLRRRAGGDACTCRTAARSATSTTSTSCAGWTGCGPCLDARARPRPSRSPSAATSTSPPTTATSGTRPRSSGATHVSRAERAALARRSRTGASSTSFRQHYDAGGLFSWWDYRAGNFHKGKGMRIDLILATAPLAERSTLVLIDRNARKGIDTRDPFAGFIIGGLDFEYDFENFPVTRELIDNIRRNDGRLTPLDVNNSSNYRMIDLLRNNAYGLYGTYQNFSLTLDGLNWGMGEEGRFTNDATTPTRLSLYKEDRYIGRATLDWQADRYNRLKFGGELTQYNIDNYSSQLTGTFFSDAYIEKPIRWNAFVEDRLDLGDVVVVGGLRYDWYDTRASRPFATDTAGNTYPFPRVSTMPGFDPANPTAPVCPGREPRLPEPARAGVVPGDRPDQLPAELLAPGAGAGLRPAPGRDQHRPGQHQHQPGLRLRPRLRQDHRLRVRHPARLQRRHGAGLRRLQQGHRERPGRPSGQPVRPGHRARQRLPDPDQPGLRQRPGLRHPAGPAVRQLLQRHHRLRLPAGQEHRLRSVHLRQLRLAGS